MLHFIYSGFVAERMDLRYFLSLGMIMSGIFVFMLGFAKVLGVHSIGYFIAMQVSRTQCGTTRNLVSLELHCTNPNCNV